MPGASLPFCLHPCQFLALFALSPGVVSLDLLSDRPSFLFAIDDTFFDATLSGILLDRTSSDDGLPDYSAGAIFHIHDTVFFDNSRSSASPLAEKPILSSFPRVSFLSTSITTSTTGSVPRASHGFIHQSANILSSLVLKGLSTSFVLTRSKIFGHQSRLQPEVWLTPKIIHKFVRW